MEVFSSIGDALAWIDPHGERTWEEPQDADETRLLISRRYKEATNPIMDTDIGSGAWRALAHWKPREPPAVSARKHADGPAVPCSRAPVRRRAREPMPKFA
jgi:hypothetical protein